MNVIVHRDTGGLAEAAARQVANTISATEGQVRIGLAGGSTPAETYRMLREMAVEWQRVEAWVTDERWVPHEHADCNGTMIADLLMDHVPASFHRPRWATWLSAADSAAHYEAALRTIHADGGSELILLGLGDDGHTASLFPGSGALDADPRRWYVANYIPQVDAERLTATYAFLHQAHQIVFLVAGGDKAPALRAVLEPLAGTTPPPAARVMDGRAEVTWLVDEEAAAELTTTEFTRGE